MRTVATLVILSSGLWVAACQAAPATSHIQCLTPDYCVCVTDTLRSTIDSTAEAFRDDIRKAHADKKFVIYLSIPFSGSEGSYPALNQEVANDIVARLESRYGAQFVWVLNPVANKQPLPKDAGAADYTYLWSQVLYRSKKDGDGVDAVYFAGPSDFSKYLHLTGTDDLGNLAAYFVARRTSDPSFGKLVNQNLITQHEFLAYYGFKASVSFSLGAHDEWNIVSEINQERRKTGNGILEQLPIWFDGAPVAPSVYEGTVSPGHAGKCP